MMALEALIELRLRGILRQLQDLLQEAFRAFASGSKQRCYLSCIIKEYRLKLLTWSKSPLLKSGQPQISNLYFPTVPIDVDLVTTQIAMHYGGLLAVQVV